MRARVPFSVLRDVSKLAKREPKGGSYFLAVRRTEGFPHRFPALALVLRPLACLKTQDGMEFVALLAFGALRHSREISASFAASQYGFYRNEWPAFLPESENINAALLFVGWGELIRRGTH